MSASTASPGRFFSHPAVIGLCLAVATFAVYFPVFGYGFINYDDNIYFFLDQHVLSGLNWENLQWAFTTGESANWHPLTWLSLMLDAQFFGKGAAAPHFTNVLLHAANSILLFHLCREWTGALWRSAILAFFFALHPLHVESVAWVAERKDVLSGFFALLALWSYTRYSTAKSSATFYGLTLFLFVCGLMAKPMLVTLPFVLLLLDFWPLQRSVPPGKLFVEKLPFFLLAAASSVVTFIVQQQGGAVSPLDKLPLDLRLENAFIAYAGYLAKIFWPVNLATPYPSPHYWPMLPIILAVALFAALCAVAVACRKKYPYAFTGWFWFAGMLVPVIGLVQVGGQSMADRYVYLPIIGILFIAVWGIGEIWARLSLPQNVLVGATTLLLLACAVRARNQVTTWQDDGTLFAHAVVVTKKNYVASVDLGAWRSQHGDTPSALDCYNNALRTNPNDPRALYDVGDAFAKLGYFDEAIRDYRHALEITPDQPDILNNLGFALARTKQLPAATQCFQAVIKLKPDSVEAHNNLATLLFMQGNFAEAANQFNQALQLKPNDPLLMVNLGDTYVRLDEKTNAVQCYEQALQLQPANQTIRAKLQSLGVTPTN